MNEEILADAGKLALRLLAGGLLLFHGVDKMLHGPGHVQTDLLEHGLPGLLAYGVYVGEVVAPLCIMAGIWTRFWAVVYSLNISFATLLVHGADFLHLAPTGGWAAELWAFYMATPMAIALLGPGRYALARASRQRRVAALAQRGRSL